MGISMRSYIGTAHVFGDNVDTDRIIAGKYTKTLDLSDLAKHVMEDIDPDFWEKVEEGVILVAGNNFGTGSSREQAPLAIQAAGVAAVVANSFARIFFRNAINVGLPAVVVGEHEIKMGQQIEVDIQKGSVKNVTTGQSYQVTAMPDVMVRILESGGLVNYLRENNEYVQPAETKS